MFKDDYNKLYQDLTPSPALNEETVALMAEAQAHPLPKAAAAPKKKWILPTAISGAAAMLAIAIGIGIWLNQPPKMMNEEKGELDAVLPGVEVDPMAPEGNASGGATGNAAPQGGFSESIGAGGAPMEQPEANKDSAEGDDAATDSGSNNSDGTGNSGDAAPAVDPRLPVILSDRKTKTYQLLLP